MAHVANPRRFCPVLRILGRGSVNIISIDTTLGIIDIGDLALEVNNESFQVRATLYIWINQR